MSLIEEVEILRRNPMFAAADPAKLKLLAFSSERLMFRPGEPLFRQDDTGTTAYFILSGTVDVVVDTQGGRIPIMRYGPGELLGAISLLIDVPRSASIVAQTDLTVLCIARECFLNIVQSNPQFALAVMRDFARRLDGALHQIQAMQPAPPPHADRPPTAEAALTHEQG